MFSFTVKLLPHFVSSLLKVMKATMLFQIWVSRSGIFEDSDLLGREGVW